MIVHLAFFILAILILIWAFKPGKDWYQGYFDDLTEEEVLRKNQKRDKH